MVDFSLQNEKQFSNSEILSEQRAQTFFKECFTFIPFALKTQRGCQRVRKNEERFPFASCYSIFRYSFRFMVFNKASGE